MKIPIRVIRTYHLEVEAEFGETKDDLITKAKELLNDNVPDEYDETLVVLHGHDSKHDTFEEYAKDNPNDPVVLEQKKGAKK